MKPKPFFIETLRVIVVLLLREALMLSLFSLAILLSLESLLPGTVSLRESMIFFILGIACMLVVERKISDTISLSSIQNPHQGASKRMRVLFFGFVLWAAFLLGNALFNFHPAIIAVILLFIVPILILFFDMAFGDRSRTKSL